MIARCFVLVVIAALVDGCSEKNKTLFRLVPPAECGIDFQNSLVETDSINILTINYMYHGGGVAIGDFNNDSLPDIFFTGNMVPNRLYLNTGRLTFRDVSEQAGIGGFNRWKSGVAAADVNDDGWLDLYVCATISKDSTARANMLFINKGLDANGIPTFEDHAHDYGIDDMGYSQNAAFLDYDKDGDLDLYVLTNLESDKIPSVYRPRILDGTALNNDRLYRNNGNGTFTNVTKQAGIRVEGYGLGIAVADINQDTWPDLYIGNDYVSNDILYINNGDGTFSNQIRARLKHQSLFTMGVDVADINNDLAPDIVTLDMLPENNLRRKTVSGAGATYYSYINNAEYDYEFQYMRNMLHLNLGNGTFSEIGELAGIHQTEWSWSSLLVDVDNDGYRDLLVTNGFPKDVTDRDYVVFKREVGAFNNIRSLLDSIPVLKVSNYAFRNNGDLTFSDNTAAWGLFRPSFSNGAAVADLDLDGDLDYVVNNINDPAFVYENKLYSNKKKANHFLRLRLIGLHAGSGSGAKITIKYGQGKSQYDDHSIYRGYLSTMEDIVHFGLGNAMSVDTLKVTWPDGKVNTVFNVAADQVLDVRYDRAVPPETIEHHSHSGLPLFAEISSSMGVNYKHPEWDRVDFYRQRTLPHKFSQAGPGLAVGDINGDGFEDFVVGGSSLYDAGIFLQKSDGSFTISTLVKTVEKKSEDEGLLLFDADEDGDNDLYAVSGSYEGEANDSRYQDRLYKNDGKGHFSLAVDALPSTLSSGSCVRAADIDLDGDLDLFVAGRVVPGSWPLQPESYVLQNNGGTFTNITARFAPQLQYAGMITDALWSDYDNDGKVDLVVVGEFMAPTIFKNTGAGLKRADDTGLAEFSGWWNSLAAGDFDKDGDTDYIAGNLGQNNLYKFSSERPLRVYAKDFDSNESIDAIVSCYLKSEKGQMQEYPVHFWDELFSQSPKFRNQFSSYKQYGSATMMQLLEPYDTSGMVVFKAVYSLTSYLENKGDGGFEVRPLPITIQVAPVNGLLVYDANNDGNLDVLMTGNDYGNEVFSGRYDAFRGVCMLGDGTGNFRILEPVRSGFLVNGDGKALARIRSAAGGALVIATQNADSLRVFRNNFSSAGAQGFSPLPTDLRADVTFANGVKEKFEFYHGSGYLSQCTRIMEIPQGARQMTVYDFSGKTRIIDLNGIARK